MPSTATSTPSSRSTSRPARVCRAELDGLREVAAAMGNSVEPLPEGLWSQIAGHLPERRAGRGAAADAAARRPRAARPSGRPADGRSRRRRTTVTMSAPSPWRPRPSPSCSASGWCGPTTRCRTSRSPSARPPATVTRRAAHARAPARHLDASSHTQLAQVVVVPSGQGYLVSSNLPSLANGQTYQLWAHRGEPADLARPARATRRAAPPSPWPARRGPSRLSITAEPAGGAVVPTGPIIATGTV